MIFLTGATGFIGAQVAASLRGSGHHVRALVRPRSSKTAPARALSALGVELVAGDLRAPSTFAESMQDAVAVIHLGGVVNPSMQDDRDEVLRINGEAPVALARAARDRGVRRFVFTSSIAAMGFRSGVATPRSRCTPATAYGRAKLHAEQGLTALARETKVDSFRTIILRPPTVYGPGERYNFLTLVRAIDRGLFRVIGRGDNVFPLCSTTNIVRALIHGARGEVTAGIHLVADDAWYSMNRVHAAIRSALGLGVDRIRLPHSVAWVAACANELAAHIVDATTSRRMRVPILLSRARVRTLTAHQPFDVASLRGCGVRLDDHLESEVAATIAEQRQSGVI